MPRVPDSSASTKRSTGQPHDENGEISNGSTANERERRVEAMELRAILWLGVPRSVRRIASQPEEKLLLAYEDAIAEWQHSGYAGKPALRFVLQGLLEGVADDILFSEGQSLN
jgi:hypothetical protein